MEVATEEYPTIAEVLTDPAKRLRVAADANSELVYDDATRV
jgi:hypothetical protein